MTSTAEKDNIMDLAFVHNAVWTGNPWLTRNCSGERINRIVLTIGVEYPILLGFHGAMWCLTWRIRNTHKSDPSNRQLWYHIIHVFTNHLRCSFAMRGIYYWARMDIKATLANCRVNTSLPKLQSRLSQPVMCNAFSLHAHTGKPWSQIFHRNRTLETCL